MSMHKLRALIVIVFSSCATGPVTVTPAASVTGNVGGEALGTVEAFLAEVVSDRGRVDLLVIGLSTAAGACERAKHDQSSKGSTNFLLTLENDRGDTLNPGVYPIITGHPTGSSGNFSRGRISKLDAACVDAFSGDAGIATAGKITLDAYSEGGSVSGSFELTVGADTLEGTFAANTCAGVSQANVETADSCQ